MEKTNIYQKLMHIQQNLKAPKDRWNAFGKYNYRSAESIVESVKPLLKETRTVLIVNTSCADCCGKPRVTCSVTLADTESDGMVTCTASVREDDQRAGMCAAQNSGATESFAKKYALGDLFAIDDTKDDDELSRGEKASVTASKPTAAGANGPQPDGKGATVAPKGSVGTSVPPKAKAKQKASEGENPLRSKMREAWDIYKQLDSVKSMDDNSRTKFFCATLKTKVGKDNPAKLTADEWDRVISDLDMMRVM